MPHPNARLNRVQVVRGQTKVLGLTIKKSDGRAASLSGAQLYMTVRKRPDADVLVSKSTDDGIQIDDAGKGQATVTLSIEDTDLEAGEYRYDIWVVYPGQNGEPDTRQPVVHYAQLHVVDGLTDFPAT